MDFRIDFQPIGRSVMIKEGITILEAAQEAGVGLSAVCGGNSTCGSCVVRITENVPVSSPTSIEEKKISKEDLQAGIRLACQTRLFGSATIEVPKESLTAIQRTQMDGEERDVKIESSISVHNLVISKAAKTDLKADWERLCDALIENGLTHRVHGHIQVISELPEKLRENDWKIQIGLRYDEVVSITAPETPILGVAIDLGTTKIAAYLVDLKTGVTLAMDGLMNPQIKYGEDVMARIAYTIKHEKGIKVLQDEVINTLNSMTAELCKQANQERSGQENTDIYSCNQIVEMVVVGNTAMHHIFMGLPVKQLGMAPYVAALSAAIEVNASDLSLHASSGAVIYSLPNIAGFVGADHVSMLLASNGFSTSGTVIYIDIGTNTEITLVTDRRMISCSTASGPAFEGAHIDDGMRAADGAVERVRIVENQIEYQTIGSKAAVGMCGSGILDAVAQLRSADIINFRGAFNKDHQLVRIGKNGLEVVIVEKTATKHGRDIVLNRKDISEIQMAKGAIRAGIELLLKSAQKRISEIDSVIIAGAFGTFIDIESAITIGMFPNLPKEKFSQVGNAAGIGAKLALLSTSQRSEASEMTKHIEYLELANHPEFTDEFAQAMSL